MEPVTMYTAQWCPDCRRAKSFMKERGVAFREIDIENDPQAAALVMRVNNGRRRIPTMEIDGRYFACSPFDAQQLATELNVPLNPVTK
jgi:glutaredoxin